MITRFNNARYSHLSEGVRAALNKRLAKELTQMLLKANQGSQSGEQYGGRESGSLAWRRERGEASDPVLGQVITVPEGASRYIVRYSPASDVYTDGTGTVLARGFNSLAYSNEDVVRKVEFDWNMVYLAREKNESISTIGKCV